MVGSMVLLMILMLVTLSRKMLRKIHLHLVPLMRLVAIEHGVLALMVALTKHAGSWWICH